MRRADGFTLIEMIIAMVVTSIVGSMVAVFIARPVQGYMDSVRRAGLSDVADGVIKRLSMELRTAVPNSVRIDASGKFIEFIPAAESARYCTDTETGCSKLSFIAGDQTFDVLGPPHTGASGDFIVVFNTGQDGLNAYAGDNIRLIANPGTTTTAIHFSGNRLPFPSPSNRFQIVRANGPVSFACENVGGTATGTGTLRRYSGYRTSLPFGNIQPTTGLGTGGLIADRIASCGFIYNPISPSEGIVSVNLTIRQANEPVSIVSQIHVDNLP
ncbi:MAG: prepilin-type N-terminal cleavage/methylation domain-containing protein [Rhodocyclaceae bacterium]|nr:prepilin-type N-terminal cleavage/methylation domain-containing protein [Rhodocyclaceae bacterium]MDZ4215219.1 prepilin-type N-terminal cleavage/methylation domain-containing protein [Rhodocyclaceae bacterium]